MDIRLPDIAVTGGVDAVHTFGDFQQFNPHLHIIATDGCFDDTASFIKALEAKAKDSEELFRHEMLKMLEAEGKITEAVVENMLSLHHSGFCVDIIIDILP